VVSVLDLGFKKITLFLLDTFILKISNRFFAWEGIEWPMEKQLGWEEMKGDGCRRGSGLELGSREGRRIPSLKF